MVRNFPCTLNCTDEQLCWRCIADRPVRQPSNAAALCYHLANDFVNMLLPLAVLLTTSLPANWGSTSVSRDTPSHPGSRHTHAGREMLQTWASAHRGKWGRLTPWKNGWKIKKRKHAKMSSFLCLCYILRAIRAGRCRERRYADHIYSDILQNAPFRSQIFEIFFASGGKGALTPNQNPADVPGYRAWHP